MQEYRYSLTEIENMLPWEREIYITLQVERERAKQQAQP